MQPLLDVLLQHVPPPAAPMDQPFSMCVAMIERDPFVGRVATGGHALGWAVGGGEAGVTVLLEAPAPWRGRAGLANVR